MTDEAKALVELFTKFLGEWGKSRQYGEVIYGLHTGTEREVELTSTSIREARDLIETQAREIERLKAEVMRQMQWKTEAQNDVDEMAVALDDIANESSDTWAREKARAALAGDSHDQ